MIIVVSKDSHELLGKTSPSVFSVPAATIYSSLSIISNTNKYHFIWEVLRLTCSDSGEHEESKGEINKEISPG